MNDRRRVLIDATPLRAGSGQRGIGQMLFSLLAGLDQIRCEWEPDLEIYALSNLDLHGRVEVTDDLTNAAHDGLAAKGTADEKLIQARRLRLPRLMAEYDVLHVPEALGSPLWGRAARVVTCHDLIPLRYPRQYLGSHLAERVRLVRDRARYRQADRVVCISRRTASDLQALIGVDEKRLDIVPLGIVQDNWRADDVADDRRRIERLGLEPGRFLVYAGFCDYRKNVEGMIATLARLKALGHEVDLAWAGHLPKPHAERIGAMSREAGVAARVRLLGYVSHDDLTALFRGALAHLFLSRLEGFGLSVAEAISVGCPVVVGRGTGSDEVAGDAALHVDPEDSGAAAREVVRLASDPELVQSLRARGLERAKSFSATAMARGYVRNYRLA